MNIHTSKPSKPIPKVTYKKMNKKETVTALKQKKPKPVTKILYGGIPANPEDLGLQLYAHDPKKYTNYNKIMIRKEIKAGNIKFLFVNRNFINKERIKRQLE